MIRFFTPMVTAGALALLSNVGSVATAAQGEFTFEGNVEIVPGESKNRAAVVLTSDVTSEDVEDMYGAIIYTPKKTLTLEELRSLQVSYEILEGGFGGGSMRFQIALDEDGDGEADCNIFVYLGEYPNFDDEVSGDVETSGELIGSTDLRFDTTQCGGEFYDDYAGAIELAGDAEIVDVALVVDSGWFFEEGVQSVLVTDLRIDKGKLKVKQPKVRNR